MCSARALSCVQLFATPWTVAHQAPLPMGFSRQEYGSGSGLPFPPPGDLPDSGIETASPADSLPLSHLGSTSWLIIGIALAVRNPFSDVCSQGFGGLKEVVRFSLGLFSFLLIYLHPLCYLDIHFLLVFFFPVFLLRQNTHNIKCTMVTPFKYKITVLCYVIMLCLWSSFHLVKLKLYPLKNNARISSLSPIPGSHPSPFCLCEFDCFTSCKWNHTISVFLYLADVT